MSIKLEHINYVYSEGTAYEKHALKDVSLEIPHGEFVGIIGHTGSGKSTLIQHLNGLIKATSGALYYNGENIYGENYNLRELRNQVGLVFQYPEHQLFEVNVLQDVCFGPKNQGLSPEECEKRAREALQLVGLKEKYFDHSPFDLSGGQKRRAAIAGVLAMRPKVLVLDEPTAGMDAFARRQMWNLLKKLNQQKLTILLTTHYMEEAETLCDRVGFMCGGRLEETDAPGHMIETLGRYAVDETSPDGLKSHYFHGKEEAIQYLSASEQETALRSTTLEDVFLETIGQQLECR